LLLREAERRLGVCRRIIEENARKTSMDELDAIQAVRDAWPYRWEEDRQW
jgi:hypothetical protein